MRTGPLPWLMRDCMKFSAKRSSLCSPSSASLATASSAISRSKSLSASLLMSSCCPYSRRARKSMAFLRASVGHEKRSSFGLERRSLISSWTGFILNRVRSRLGRSRTSMWLMGLRPSPSGQHPWRCSRPLSRFCRDIRPPWPKSHSHGAVATLPSPRPRHPRRLRPL